jgi:hypothetical protein
MFLFDWFWGVLSSLGSFPDSIKRRRQEARQFFFPSKKNFVSRRAFGQFYLLPVAHSLLILDL